MGGLSDWPGSHLQTKLLFDSESRGKAGSLELLPDQSQNTVLLGNLPDYYR